MKNMESLKNEIREALESEELTRNELLKLIPVCKSCKIKGGIISVIFFGVIIGIGMILGSTFIY